MIPSGPILDQSSWISSSSGIFLGLGLRKDNFLTQSSYKRRRVYSLEQAVIFRVGGESGEQHSTSASSIVNWPLYHSFKLPIGFPHQGTVLGTLD